MSSSDASDYYATAPYIIIVNKDISKGEFKEIPRWASDVDTTIRSPDDNTTPTNPFDLTFNFGGVKGFAGVFNKRTIDEINARPDVDFVERDTYVYPGGISDIFAANENQLWGLTAISHPPGDFTAQSQYTPDESGGEGITAYVIDTGIRTTHEDFGGRAKWGINLVPNSQDTDTHGHGTHVSGTIAGTKHGVAKKAEVVAVKVFGDDQGNTGSPTSRIISALQWVVQQVTNPNTPEKGPHNSIVNMSLRGPFNRAFNQAINAAVTAGITCIVAAGNDNKDAAHMSPASADSAFTVGSVDSEYNRYKSSNYGSRLEIFAPGHKILSCGIDHDTDTTVATGTSMACPHVTGVAAYLMRLEGLKTPKQVCIRLRKLAVKNVVKNIGSPDTPNLFLFNGGGK